jgi:hypothetical protein
MISVVIPTYNRLALVQEAVASALGPSTAEVEVVVADDGSTDDTLAALHDTFGHDPRLRLLEKPPSTPRGAPAARNRGALAAAGDHLVFLDSDDLLAPHALAHRSALFRAHDGLDFVVTQQQWLVERPYAGAPLVGVPYWYSLLDRSLLPCHAFNPAAVTWTRAAFLRTGPWDESLRIGQDWDQHMRLYLTSARFVWDATPDCWYRAADPRQGRRISSAAPDVAQCRTLAHTLLGTVERLATSARLSERRAGLALLGLTKLAVQEQHRVGVLASRIATDPRLRHLPADWVGGMQELLAALAPHRQHESAARQRQRAALGLARRVPAVPFDVRLERVRPPLHRPLHALFAAGPLRSDA